MTVYFEITSAQGVPARVALKPGVQKIRAAIGDQYRIYDEATGKSPPGIVVKRFDSHMLIEGLPGGAQVELTDFYARCGVSSPCTFVVEPDALFSDAPVPISPASPPLQALTDGSFVMYPRDYSGAPALAVADGEGFSSSTLYAVGGLSIAALAASAGGGGSSSGPVAVSPSPPPPDPGDKTPPAEPVVTSEKTAVTRTPVIEGRAEAGSTVRVDIDIDRDGQAEASYATFAGADGHWSVDLASATPAAGGLPPQGLPDGSVSLVTITAIDANQNQSATALFELAVDASAPAAPRITAIVDDVPGYVGVVEDDGRTNDRAPRIQGRLGEPLAQDERLEVTRDGTVLGGVVIDGLSWRVDDAGLAFGNDYTYVARVVDDAGRASASEGYRIVVAPGTSNQATVTGVTDDVPARTGNVANGGVTNDATPTIVGRLAEPLAAGERIEVLRNGAAVGGSVLVDGDTWRVTDSRIADGSHVYSARVVDAEGTGPASTGYRITVDTVNNKTASITSITDNVLPGIGTVRDGGTTNDPSPTLRGSLSAPLAAGEELQVLRNDTVITSSPSVAGRNWSFTDGGLTSGDYDYTVRVVDAAGNIGRESAVYDLRVSLPRGAGLGSDDLLPDADAPVAPAALSLDELALVGDEPFASSAPAPQLPSFTVTALPPAGTLEQLLSA
ncbi:MAG: hypothetical protein GX652_09130 [Burkholderiaceae bacterium]|nr:hypothetical protein [Burkholderiaceae bacterium]